MKMITAVINRRDAAEACRALSDAGFIFTKVNSSGGFLKTGNTTLITGVKDEDVEKVISVIRAHCSSRMEPMPGAVFSETSGAVQIPQVSPIPVGGAAVFVTDLISFEKF